MILESVKSALTLGGLLTKLFKFIKPSKLLTRLREAPTAMKWLAIVLLPLLFALAHGLDHALEVIVLHLASQAL